jgi:hypothetical protein
LRSIFLISAIAHKPVVGFEHYGVRLDKIHVNASSSTHDEWETY